MFEYSDYIKNPGKYELFKTAKVNTHVFTENGETDLEKGQYVAVQFLRHAYNAMRRRQEPVYSVTTGGKVWGYMFANALSEFVL
jgi:hypothetical protein